MRIFRIVLVLAAASVTLARVAGIDQLEEVAQGDWAWTIPDGFPEPVVPSDNPMGAAKVKLGRYLFYDQRMSVNGRGSCSTCHIQSRGFADSRPVAIGVTGERHPRRAMPLANVAYFGLFNWANPTVHRLEDQSKTPLFGTHPVELGLSENDRFLKVLQSDGVYRGLFPAAFPGESGSWNFEHVRKSLAAFERVLLSGSSPYDRYHFGGDEKAISESAKRGEDLFFHQPFNCRRCHGGFTFGGGPTVLRKQVEDTTAAETEFFNTGLYNLPGPFSFPLDNLGLYEFTKDLKDVGKFRAPSLRNVAVRAPSCMMAASPLLVRYSTTTPPEAIVFIVAAMQERATRIRTRADSSEVFL